MTDTTYTVGYLMDRTFDLLLGANRENLNQLTSNIGATDTTIAMNYPSGQAKQGSYIAIDDEVMYVWSATDNSNGSTVTIMRGMKGTTAATHNASTVVYVNPYFTRYQVRNTLQDEIRSWGPQVFAVKSTDIAATDFVRGYDMSALNPSYFVIDVQRSPDSLCDVAPLDEMWPSVPFRVVRSANTTSFPSGQALMITGTDAIYDSPTFHVVYAAPIDVDSPQSPNTVPFQDSDSLAVMGMDNSDIDIAPYGAAWRLASSREVRRMLTEAMGATADLQNFPPGYMVKTAEEFKMLRDSRLADAQERLRAQYPIKRQSA